MTARAALSRADIMRGLHRLDEMARKAGKVIDLAIYGGAALSLAFDMRVTTRDVDAVVRGSPDFVRAASGRIAEEEGWPSDWLNDGVKGFLSPNEEMRLMREFGAAEGGGLRVFMPSPQYLFAMKCMAMRPEGIDGSHDVSDIEALTIAADIRDARAALDIVEAFYPDRGIPPRVRFGVEEIMERVAAARRKSTARRPKKR